MFQLTEEEFDSLRSQSVISKRRNGGRRYLPYAFTEQGVAMLSSVLHSHRAIEVNIAIMRAFMRLTKMIASHHELARKLAELEERIEEHDDDIKMIFEAMRQLMEPPENPPRKIGFEVSEKKASYSDR